MQDHPNQYLQFVIVGTSLDEREIDVNEDGATMTVTLEQHALSEVQPWELQEAVLLLHSGRDAMPGTMTVTPGGSHDEFEAGWAIELPVMRPGESVDVPLLVKTGLGVNAETPPADPGDYPIKQRSPLPIRVW